MVEPKLKQGIYTFRHQYGNVYKSDDHYLYTRDEISGVFIVVTTAYAKKSKFKRILEIIKEK
jgi:hypothetical protein